MTSRDQIESSAELIDNLLSGVTSKQSGAAKQLIDLNAQVSPAVLAGIFGINVSMIYQYRQDGKLPPNSDASLRDCVKWHTSYWKTKSISKASSMGEAALIQKIKLDHAKTEQAWLAIKKERGELVDTVILAEQFEGHFIHLRMQLCAIARRKPEIQTDVDKILSEWSKLGTDLMVKSQEELDYFIEEKMQEEVLVEAPEGEEPNGD